MDGTILTQGSFTQPAVAVAQTIIVPSGIDNLTIYNVTQAAAGAVGNASFSYWQLGMGTQGFYFTGTGAAGQSAANSFVVYNPGIASNSAPVAITNINAGTGLVTTANTAGIAVGSVVRLFGLGAAAAQQLAGVDFTVSAVTTNTNFTVAAVPGAAAIGATTGFYTIVPTGLFYPRVRTILSITAANPGVVTTTVPHGYQVGQEVRFTIPTVTATAYGMTQLNNLSAIITAVTATTFTININTTGFTAFAWPLAANSPFSPALVVPFGDDTATALAQVPPLSSLEDSVQNVAFLGMTLATGALLPAGVANDVIYWEASKATMGGS